jgi:hypothetical protein
MPRVNVTGVAGRSAEFTHESVRLVPIVLVVGGKYSVPAGAHTPLEQLKPNPQTPVGQLVPRPAVELQTPNEHPSAHSVPRT